MILAAKAHAAAGVLIADPQAEFLPPTWRKRLVANSADVLPPQEIASPYAICINPDTGVGPMAIDTSTFTSGPTTMAGGIRNSKQFWGQWLDTYPNTLSQTNVDMVNSGLSPVVDDAWVTEFPQHAGYEGDTLIHHH